MENQLCLFSFEEVLNASATGFIICSSADVSPGAGGSNCVFANRAAQKMTGIADPVGQTLLSVYGEQFDCQTLESLGTIAYQSEKTGLWCRIVKSELNTNSCLYTITDITAEKQAEFRLSHLMKLSSEAEETMEFGSWIWDINNSTYEWTEGMYRLMGYKPEDASFSKLDSSFFKKNIHPDDLEMITGKFKNVLSYTDTYILEFRVIAEGGHEKYLYVRGHNTIDEITGHIISIGTAFNVSTLREIQRELEQKVSDLNTSNAELEQFAYIASHDLQEPLRKIVSFGERLETKTKDILNDEQSQYLNRILSATRRMQKMINNLLEFSRVASSSKVFEPTDLNEVLKSTLSDLEVTIQQNKATLDLDELPVIEANPTQISQLFINLISNSLKFTQPGVDPVISLRLSEVPLAEIQRRKLMTDKRYISITLKDNGIGFSNENAARIFTIFQRLRGRSEYEGAGIGLSVCKKVVEGHQGIIEAFGVPDEGATFEVILPVSQN
ncbi:ATP-binding protein [Dyadobacter sp. LHD-138]|uniref:sensor histidine kinase n=1 Tax=Dyadobacter sp. LHD-138 TaxID=3071413 RepID=UPI0027E185AE|nr:ATP-binding protein [Dyadobacter sp. LHD-138]MDQ6477336.1 ATP-binding protein [Dyadobacter sp. LHD-138]